MTRKYEKLDTKLLAWLGINRTGVSTSSAISALGISGKTAERHVSRQFTALQNKGVLVCELQGTTRVCKVIKDPPSTLSKERWRPKHEPKAQAAAAPNITAVDSAAFEAAGGMIQKLPNNWDKPITQKALGAMTFSDYISSLD